MGSFFSSDAYAAATPEEESSSAVLKFHSTARWQLHFNACKETSKLVTFRSLSSSTLQIWNFRFSDFCFVFFGWNRWAKLVIDFSAAWCGPCKMMEPVFNGMAAKFTDVDFVKIDVDELSVRHTSILSISWGFGFWFCFVLFFFYRSFRSIRNLSFWFFFFFFSKDVSQDFGVQAMPTFVLLKGGKEVDRVVGAKKDELDSKVQKHRSA